MSSQVGDKMKPSAWARRLNTLSSGSLPLAVAFQGLALMAVAFSLGGSSRATENGGAVETGWLMKSPPLQAAVESQIPADLRKEQIRLPRFPSRDEPARRREPASPRDENPNGLGLRRSTSLTALRVASVELAAPVAHQPALTLAQAPDRLTPGTFSAIPTGGLVGRSSPGGREGGWTAGGLGTIGRGTNACERGTVRYLVGR